MRKSLPGLTAAFLLASLGSPQVILADSSHFAPDRPTDIRRRTEEDSPQLDVSVTLLRLFARVLQSYERIPGETTEQKMEGLSEISNGGQALLPADGDFTRLLPGQGIEKALAAQKILQGIEGNTLAEKMKVVAALTALFPKEARRAQGSPRIQLSDRPVPSKEELRQIFEALAAMAGSDGYLNHRDTGPIVQSLLSGDSRRKIVRSLIRQLPPEYRDVARLATGAGAGLLARLARRKTLARFDATVKELAASSIDDSLDLLGVQPSPEGQPDGPATRALPLDKLVTLPTLPTQEAVRNPHSGLRLRSEEVEQLARVLDLFRDRKLSFPEGIPIGKLRPLIVDGTLPTDLKIRLNEEGGVEIR